MNPLLAPEAVPLGAILVPFGKPTVPLAIEGVPFSVPVMYGGTVPEFETVSAAVTDPSSLPGMADPTPELVKGVGMARVAVSGMSAGSFS